MSAASFLGISGMIYLNGYDGLVYAVGFLVGWPVILFLMAEKLRNLGKFTFTDIAAYRLYVCCFFPWYFWNDLLKWI